MRRILNTLLLQASVLTPPLHTASMPPRRHTAAGGPATSRRQSKVINSLLFTFIVLSCFLYSLCPSFFFFFFSVFSHFFDRYILLQATGNITQVLKSVRPRLHLRLMPLPRHDCGQTAQLLSVAARSRPSSCSQQYEVVFYMRPEATHKNASD